MATGVFRSEIHLMSICAIVLLEIGIILLELQDRARLAVVKSCLLGILFELF